MINMGQKQPFEEFYFRFWFTNVLSSGDVLSNLEETEVVNYDTGEDVSETLIDSSKTVVGATSVDIWLKGGETGNTYKYTLRARTANGEGIEADGVLAVFEL